MTRKLVGRLAGVACALMAACGGNAGDDDDVVFDAAIGVDARAPGVDAAGPDAPVPDAADVADAAPPDAALPVDCTGITEPVLGPASGFAAVRVHADDPLLRGVGSIVGDGAGALWGQDPVGSGISGDRVIAIATDGTVSSLAAPANLTTCTVSQIARNPDGDLFLYNLTSNRLLRITTAGAVTEFSTVGDVGGGGNCTDSGVIGIAGLADGTFAVGSPVAGKLFALSADGATRTDVADVAAVLRVEPDGAGGFYVAVFSGALQHVTAGGVVTEVLDASHAVRSVRRDDDGTLYLASGSRVLRTDALGSEPVEVAACIPGTVMDLELDAPSDGTGPSSLYVSSIGASIDANDGDAIYELTR